MTILDLIAQRKAFTPSTVNEFVALQVARRLRDTENSDWYRHIANRHTIPTLLRAYGSAMRAIAGKRIERFRNSLTN